MRKIALLNAIGERYELNGGEIFFNTPKGLGMANQDEFADLENGFFQVVNGKNKPQASITGELVFLKWAYSRYKKLVDWMAKEDELVLAYQPGDTEYYRRVRIGQMTKSELETGKWLRVPVDLQCLTPWYLPTAVEINFEGDSEAVMRYEYRYDGNLIYGSDGGNAYRAVIPARGHVPASLRVRYAGASANFRAALVGQTSRREYGRCQIEGESAAGDVIELSTDPRDSFVRKNGKDWFDAVDITHEVFFRVPTDENCELQLEADNELTGTVEAQVLYYFRTV